MIEKLNKQIDSLMLRPETNFRNVQINALLVRIEAFKKLAK